MLIKKRQTSKTFIHLPFDLHIQKSVSIVLPNLDIPTERAEILKVHLQVGEHFKS